MDSFSMTLALRLLLATLFGGLIGLEREYRAKEAGLRTHFLVALGSALFMIVSQFGFTGTLEMILAKQGAEFPVHADVGRLAAQIVTGIGFLGAGTIVLHRHFVVGLTTAAAIWTTSAIGVAVGAGMYTLGAVATLLALAGLELFILVDKRVNKVRRELQVSLWAENDEAVSEAVRALTAYKGAILSAYSARRHSGGGITATFTLAAPVNSLTPSMVLSTLGKIKGVETETVTQE